MIVCYWCNTPYNQFGASFMRACTCLPIRQKGKRDLK